MDLIFPAQKQALQTNYINHYIDKIQKTRDIFLGWGVQHGAVRIVKNLLKVSTSNPSQKLTPFGYTQ